ncbi:MAG TPA: hypothetical protein VFQ00_12430 [Terriglobales bacterium]|nr:hypothetical protein [Terriglobales bacterium]
MKSGASTQRIAAGRATDFRNLVLPATLGKSTQMQIPVALPGMEGQKLTLQPSSFLSGPKLTLNGQLVAKEKGSFCVRSNAGSPLTIKLKPRLLDPIPDLKLGEQIIQLTPPLQWYQYAWIALPVFLVFAGGAIGGLFGAMAAGISSHVFRSDRSEPMKYALTGLISLGAFAAYMIVAGTIVAKIGR